MYDWRVDVVKNTSGDATALLQIRATGIRNHRRTYTVAWAIH
jgi:hypothetical protein